MRAAIADTRYATWPFESIVQRMNFEAVEILRYVGRELRPYEARDLKRRLAKAKELRRVAGLVLSALPACPCGSPIIGRTDARYCSNACRQRAHRALVSA